MTNKLMMSAVVILLAAGVISLGMEVKNLRGEVARLSQRPLPQASVSQPTPPQRIVRPKPIQKDDWWPSANRQWDPYVDLAQIQNQMNRLFNESFHNGFWGQGNPAGNIYDVNTDVKDANDKYVISMDLPGMGKDNIDVKVDNNTLLISGERNNENEEENANYYAKERSFGYFSKSLLLPQDADASGISVNYKKGVLKIEIPKLAKTAAPKDEPTKITVN